MKPLSVCWPQPICGGQAGAACQGEGPQGHMQDAVGRGPAVTRRLDGESSTRGHDTCRWAQTEVVGTGCLQGMSPARY